MAILDSALHAPGSGVEGAAVDCWLWLVALKGRNTALAVQVAVAVVGGCPEAFEAQIEKEKHVAASTHLLKVLAALAAHQLCQLVAHSLNECHIWGDTGNHLQCSQNP